MLLRYILHADIDKDDFDNKIKLFQKAETRTTAMSLAESESTRSSPCLEGCVGEVVSRLLHLHEMRPVAAGESC